jgi:SAM-dependent methyltransferase
MSETFGVGYDWVAAAPDAWRRFDPDDPQPGYFEFDWLSARHPDLYDRCALTSDALVAELGRLVGFAGLDVIDVGAGTGRSAIGLARLGARVIAVDAYSTVVDFGARAARKAGVANVHYLRGDRARLPARNGSVDAVVACWADLDRVEAARVLRPGGLLVSMGGHPTEPSELTPVLAPDFPDLVPPVPDGFDGRRSGDTVDAVLAASEWPDVDLADGGLHAHDFTATAEYGSPEEAAAILGRLFGPATARYLTERRQSSTWSRLRISFGHIAAT